MNTCASTKTGCEVSACPICLVDFDQIQKEEDERVVGATDASSSRNRLVQAPCCSHAFCLRCMEAMLLHPSSKPTESDRRIRVRDSVIESFPPKLPDDFLDMTTRGVCPMCRAGLSFFDLTYYKKPQYPFSTHRGRAPPTSLFASPDYVVKRMDRLEDTPVAGRVYEFPDTEVKNMLNDHVVPPRTSKETLAFPSDDEDRPFRITTSLDYEMPINNIVGIISESSEYNYVRDICFHEPTRTLQFSVTMRREEILEELDLQLDYPTYHQKWQYILTFSWDYRSILRGVRLVYKTHLRRPHQLGDEELSAEQQTTLFPFDGVWEEEQKPCASDFPRSVTIHGNRVMMTRITTTPFGETKQSVSEGFIHLRIPDDADSETQLSIDGTTYDLDVSMDPVFYWRAAGMPMLEVVWTRKERCMSSCLFQVIHLPFFYEIFTPSSIVWITPVMGLTTPLLNFDTCYLKYWDFEPKYNKADLWGNVFIDRMLMGMESLHFEENGCLAYISMEHEGVMRCELLDNGSPVPSRIAFSDVYWNAASRSFRGTIDWMGILGTTWYGHRSWRYEIQFARDFSCIVGGYVSGLPVGSSSEVDLCAFVLDKKSVNAGLLLECWDTPEEAFEDRVTRIQTRMEEDLAEASHSMFSAASSDDNATVFRGQCAIYEMLGYFDAASIGEMKSPRFFQWRLVQPKSASWDEATKHTNRCNLYY